MRKKFSYLFPILLTFLTPHVSTAPSLETQPQNTIERILERQDLYVNIFPNEFYTVGEKFTYSGKIQNIRDSKIKIDNETDGLEWTLLKGDKIIDTRGFQEDFSIILRKHGFIEFSYVNDKLKIKTLNTIININGETYDIRYPSFISPFIPSISLDLDIPLYEFTQPGVYTSRLKFKYDFEGNLYETILDSKEFEVRKKE